VTVDAIGGTAVMGYDPLNGSTQKPWYGDSHLELLAKAGVGTNDPGRIEVAGLSLKEGFTSTSRAWGWIKKHAK
jgi:hypothetical protein